MSRHPNHNHHRGSHDSVILHPPTSDDCSQSEYGAGASVSGDLTAESTTTGTQSHGYDGDVQGKKPSDSQLTFIQDMEREFRERGKEAALKLKAKMSTIHDGAPLRVGPYQTPRERKHELRGAFDYYQRRGNWERAREKYPKVWKDQTFKTVEEVKSSIPEAIIAARSGGFYLSQPAGRSLPPEFISTTVFFDTGNLVGPLISSDKLWDLGYTMEDVDTENRLGYQGATGATMETLGSIQIERILAKDDPSSKVLEFQVWDDKVGLAEVMLGADEDSGHHGGDFPGLLPIIPKYRLNKEKREELANDRAAWRAQEQRETRNHLTVDAPTRDPSAPNTPRQTLSARPSGTSLRPSTSSRRSSVMPRPPSHRSATPRPSTHRSVTPRPTTPSPSASPPPTLQSLTPDLSTPIEKTGSTGLPVSTSQTPGRSKQHEKRKKHSSPSQSQPSTNTKEEPKSGCSSYFSSCIVM
ncbi:hypothetical protein B0T25DRAFT_362956 [Lasiosphaeria hispida]|uniref:Uncharacterized protein n=1 Tax=Lasiosphaeria hispida TaxID=260671 RepID=A0AAJ0H528_9PEZI|nr:hypothetical protein B0T25DRAFT_362956 [Lasiosphaeria hispida]